MFTVKFCRYDNEEKSTQTLSISCKAYEFIETPNQCYVIVYDGFSPSSNGVEYHISDGKDGSYGSCFVENMAGKTIARYRTEASL